MCYAIPGKVEQVNEKSVILDYFGQRKKAINELKVLSRGDYVYAQGGYVIEKVPVAQAQEILLAWKDVFFQLQKVDLRLSSINLKEGNLKTKLGGILDKAGTGKQLNKDELLYLMDLENEKEIGFLFRMANFLRQKYHQNSCCVHGIIEISNYCLRNCAYCGILAGNKIVKRYRMNKDEILKAAGQAIEGYGFKALVLQSGEGAYGVDELVEIIRAIKEKYSVLIIISFGEVGDAGLKKLFDAGARGLLLRFETSNPALYAKLHPGYSLDTRLKEIRKAYELGYLIFTGGLIGLPGQTYKDIINDIYLAQELNAEMFSFGPFLPHPHTPLAGHLLSSESKILKVLALSRLVASEQAKILVTTAF